MKIDNSQYKKITWIQKSIKIIRFRPGLNRFSNSYRQTTFDDA